MNYQTPIFNLLSDLFCHELCYNIHEVTIFGHLKPGLNLIFGYISNSVKNTSKEVQKLCDNQAQYTQLQEEQVVQKRRVVTEVKFSMLKCSPHYFGTF